MYRGLSRIQCEWGKVETAVQQLEHGKSLGKPATIPGNESRWLVAEARLAVAQGDLAGALALLDEAERVYVRSPYPVPEPFAAQRRGFGSCRAS